MGTMCDAKKILWFLLRSLQSSRGQMTAHELVRGQGNTETFVLKNPARPSEEAGVRAGGSGGPWWDGHTWIAIPDLLGPAAWPRPSFYTSLSLCFFIDHMRITSSFCIGVNGAGRKAWYWAGTDQCQSLQPFPFIKLFTTALPRVTNEIGHQNYSCALPCASFRKPIAPLVADSRVVC